MILFQPFPIRLEIQIIERFERESDPTLLVATLCLMEVSARGLLETELLTILGDERLAMPECDKDADTEKSEDPNQNIPFFLEFNSLI